MPPDPFSVCQPSDTPVSSICYFVVLVSIPSNHDQSRSTERNGYNGQPEVVILSVRPY